MNIYNGKIAIRERERKSQPWYTIHTLLIILYTYTYIPMRNCYYYYSIFVLSLAYFQLLDIKDISFAHITSQNENCTSTFLLLLSRTVFVVVTSPYKYLIRTSACSVKQQFIQCPMRIGFDYSFEKFYIQKLSSIF